MIVQPTKVALRACNINGADLRKSCQSIFVYETMCKPYLTATITINDSSNIINNLGLRGGERVSFVIDTGIGKVYESVQYILSIQETEDQSNFRTMLYTIQTASEAFFNDRASLVQRSDVNIPATSAVEAIHNEFIGKDAPLQVMLPSLGLIAKTDIGGYITSNKKPFKAIEDILNRCSYGSIKTGSTVYFRNKDSYVIAPLEHLFNTMSPQDTYVQKQTFGSNFTDSFNAYNAIIHASTSVDENEGKQRGGMSNLVENAKASINVFDNAMGKEVLAKAAQIAPTVGSGLTSIAQKFGKGNFGHNVVQMDSRRNSPSTDQSLNMVAQNMFQAQVKDSVNYYIKVPIQSGINATVGKGINAKLLPPVGDLPKGYNSTGGLMLVADLCHECYFDAREVQGTTTMRAVQISYNV
jgi:hypothetical protein